MEKDWIKIFATDDLQHAQQLIIYLGEHNIKAVLMEKEDSSFHTFGENEIYVHTSNAEMASELTAEFNN